MRSTIKGRVCPKVVNFLCSACNILAIRGKTKETTVCQTKKKTNEINNSNYSLARSVAEDGIDPWKKYEMKNLVTLSHEITSKTTNKTVLEECAESHSHRAGPSVSWTNQRLIKDTKTKCRHLIKLTCKGTLKQMFIRVYRMEIQSVVLVFSTQLCNLLHLLSGSPPPPPSLCQSTVYTDSEWLGVGGVC